MHRLSLARRSCLAVTFAAASAVAAPIPEEIQVHDSELNAPGEFTMQFHLQMTPSTDPTHGSDEGPDVTRSWRSMVELTWGLAPNWEVGVHLPAARVEDATYASPPRLRLKWLPLRPGVEGGFFAGANFEVGHRQPKLESGMNTFEIRPIFGYENADWLVAVNPLLEWAIGGDERSRTPGFSPSAKITRTVFAGVRTGAEFYADLGAINRIEPVAAQQQTLYWVIDVDRGPYAFHVGVGRGLNAETPATTFKTVISVPLP